MFSIFRGTNPPRAVYCLSRQIPIYVVIIHGVDKLWVGKDDMGRFTGFLAEEVEVDARVIVRYEKLFDITVLVVLLRSTRAQENIKSSVSSVHILKTFSTLRGLTRVLFVFKKKNFVSSKGIRR